MADTDEADVRRVLDALAEAWDRHDADAFGAQFSDDASYITFLGTEYRGRADIERSHAALFAGPLKRTRLAGEITEIRFPADDLAIVTGVGDTYTGKHPRTLGKRQTFVLVRRVEGWRIVAFHNTRRRRLLERLQFRFAPGSAPAV